MNMGDRIFELEKKIKILEDRVKKLEDKLDDSNFDELLKFKINRELFRRGIYRRDLT